MSSLMTTPATFHIPQSRRKLLHSLLLTTGGFITQRVYAEALTLSPRATEGPYYPDHLPLDQDNNLLQIMGNQAPATGIITEFGGRVLDVDGKALSAASVELWQADSHGYYIHSKGAPKGKERDPQFQGFGKITTNDKGEYRFRTIKPAAYPSRTRHFHIAVIHNGKRLLTTQLYFAGEPQNEKDGILRRIADEQQRLSVIREFKPMTNGSQELVATWDIVVGMTPEDPEKRHAGPPPKR